MAGSRTTPSPSNFFSPLLTCSSFLPGTPENNNLAEFCNPRIDAEIARARSLQTSDPQAAARALEQGRPRRRRPGPLARPREPPGDRLRLAPGRQLPVQPPVGRAPRPDLGQIGREDPGDEEPDPFGASRTCGVHGEGEAPATSRPRVQPAPWRARSGDATALEQVRGPSRTRCTSRRFRVRGRR